MAKKTTKQIAYGHPEAEPQGIHRIKKNAHNNLPGAFFSQTKIKI